MRRICSIASNIADYRIDTFIFLQLLDAAIRLAQRASLPLLTPPFPFRTPYCPEPRPTRYARRNFDAQTCLSNSPVSTVSATWSQQNPRITFREHFGRRSKKIAPGMPEGYGRFCYCRSLLAPLLPFLAAFLGLALAFFFAGFLAFLAGFFCRFLGGFGADLGGRFFGWRLGRRLSWERPWLPGLPRRRLQALPRSGSLLPRPTSPRSPPRSSSSSRRDNSSSSSN